MFEGLLLARIMLIISYNFQKGFKSDEFEGHAITFTLLVNNVFKLDICCGSLSCLMIKYNRSINQDNY